MSIFLTGEVRGSDLLYSCIRDVGGKHAADSFKADPERRLGRAIESMLLEMPNVEQRVESARRDSALESPVWRRVGKGGVTVEYYFRLKDAAVAALLPLAGTLAALLSSNPVSSALAAAELMKSVWQRIVALRSDEDSDALALLRTLASRRVQQSASPPSYPSTKDLIEDSPTLGEAGVIAALRKLSVLRLAKCRAWASQAGDFADLGNRWEESL